MQNAKTAKILKGGNYTRKILLLKDEIMAQ